MPVSDRPCERNASHVRIADRKEAHLLRATSEYFGHYHAERNHQGLDNELIEAGDLPFAGEVHCRERRGVLLKHYYRAA